MSTTFAVIEAEALGLSPEERVTLADHLLASLSAEHDGIEQAWADEVGRRVREIETGRMPLLSLEEAVASARQAIR